MKHGELKVHTSSAPRRRQMVIALHKRGDDELIIAEVVGLGLERVKQILRAEGLYASRKIPKRWDDDAISSVRLMLAEGLSYSAIGRSFSVSGVRIKQVIEEDDRKRRRRKSLTNSPA